MYLVNRLAWIKRMIERVVTKYYYLKISLSEAGHCQDTGTNVDLGKNGIWGQTKWLDSVLGSKRYQNLDI